MSLLGTKRQVWLSGDVYDILRTAAPHELQDETATAEMLCNAILAQTTASPEYEPYRLKLQMRAEALRRADAEWEATASGAGNQPELPPPAA